MAVKAWTLRIATAGAIALTTALLTAATSGAQSADLDYACGLDGIGASTFTTVMDTGAPESAFAGQQISTILSSAITMDTNTTNALRELAITTVEGTATATLDASGTAVSSNLVLPVTPVLIGSVISSAGPLAMSGSDVPAGLTLSAGSFTAHLIFKTADGAVRVTSDALCNLEPDQDATVDTVTLSHDGTTATIKARDITRGKVAKASAKVIGEHGGAATGRVTAVLLHARKAVGRVTARLQGGRAVLNFGRLTSGGRYKAKVTYAGNTSFGASAAHTTFMVS